MNCTIWDTFTLQRASLSTETTWQCCVSKCMLFRQKMNVIFFYVFLRHHTEGWVSHGRRNSRFEAKSKPVLTEWGFWTVWCLLLLQERGWSYCGRWGHSEIFLWRADILESTNENKLQLSVYQPPTHNCLGTWSIHTILHPFTTTVRACLVNLLEVMGWEWKQSWHASLGLLYVTIC